MFGRARAGRAAASLPAGGDGGLLQNAGLEFYQEISAENPLVKKLLESTHAFRNDEYLWWQVSEYTYDSFMIRNGVRS